MSEVNPFENIRPELRSEEDDIRRGVFSRALRNLAASTPEQKLAWCAAIDEIYQSHRSRASGKKKETDALIGHKREREGSNHLEDIIKGQEQESDSSPGQGGKNSISGPAGCTVKTSENANLKISSNHDHHIMEVKGEEAVEADKVYLESDAAANRYIGAFLHSQVERAVGATLHSLESGSLRFLCTVLGLTTRSKSKETLYNMLASFHYTHCEVLGKRVSRSTFVDQQTKEYSEFLLKLPKAKATKGTKKDSTVTTPSPPPPPLEKHLQKTMPTKEVGTTSVSASNSTSVADHWTARTSSSGSRNALNRQSTRVAGAGNGSDRIVNSNNNDDSYSPPVIIGRRESANTEVMISYPSATFQTASTRSAVSQQTSSYSVSSSREEDWSTERLEKSIATIVRNYDPVTASIVLKKLAKIGYSSPEAPQVVENCLQRFHQKKYIHYENGIAYCLD